MLMEFVDSFDFVLLQQIVIWSDGDVDVKVVDLVVCNDCLCEGDEILCVELCSLMGGVQFGGCLFVQVMFGDVDFLQDNFFVDLVSVGQKFLSDMIVDGGFVVVWMVVNVVGINVVGCSFDFIGQLIGELFEVLGDLLSEGVEIIGMDVVVWCDGSFVVVWMEIDVDNVGGIV